MEVSDLNKLLKMQRQMADMMKKMGKMGKGGMLKQAMKGMFGKGGMPEMPAGMDPPPWTPKRWKRRPNNWGPVASAKACPASAAALCRQGSLDLGKRNDFILPQILTPTASHRS